MLFVENSMKQVVCVDEAFHQNVGFAFANQLDCQKGCLIAVGSFDVVDMINVRCNIRIGFNRSLGTYKDGIYETIVQSTGHGGLRG